MTTKSNYQERAQFILKKAIEKQPLLTQKISTFFTQIYKKQQEQQHKEKQQKHFTLEIDEVNHMGSLSNEVYKVNLKNGNILIVKHYFDILKDFVQRDIEHELLKIMTKKKRYPYVFYMDHFCRVQAFIPGTSISRDKLTSQLLMKITESLVDFSIEYQLISKDKSVSTSRQIANLFQTYANIYKTKKAQNPELVEKVSEYVDGVLQKKEILENLTKLLKNHKMVMNHNDSNLSNILILNFLQNKNPEIQLLDFEFANLNYVGYDLGNLLNEIATDYGGAYGVDNLGKEQKFQIREDWQVSEELVRNITNRYFDLLEGQEKSTQKERIRQVRIGRLLSHLFWLFVGLKQIDDPNIDLNMTYYVRRRYQEFIKLYNQLIL